MLPLLQSFPWKSWRRLLLGGRRCSIQRTQRLARSFRPGLEALEERTVLSMFTVNNLNDSGVGSLRDAILAGNANPGSTINFAPGLTGTIKLKSELDIKASMEIDGPGAAALSVSGQQHTRVFGVASGEVHINDLTIANGSPAPGTDPAGGGIHAVGGKLDLSGVTFTNNQAGLFGGGLFAESVIITVTNCLFTGNRVVGPPSWQFSVGGGAMITTDCSLTVVGSCFTNNTVLGSSGVTGGLDTRVGAARGGAVWSLSDHLGDTYIGCTFSGNTALGGKADQGGSGNYIIGNGMGGAIEFVSTMGQLVQCKFNNNVAQGSKGYDGVGGGQLGLGLGGAICADTVSSISCSDSTFSGNRAVGASLGFARASTLANVAEGGAIYAADAGTYLNIDGSTFSSNTVVGGIAAITSSTDPSVPGSFAEGGAIWLGHASADISNSTFTRNVALGGNATGADLGGFGSGGAIESFANVLTLSNSKFTNNRAQGGLGGASGGSGGAAFGGGLSVDGSFVGSLTLLDLVFSGNQALGGTAQGGQAAFGGFAYGGAIYLQATSATADGLTLKSNVAQGGTGVSGANGGWGQGGGLAAYANVTLVIANSLISLNRAVAGVALGGGGNGFGYGGGIYHSGVLDLPNTTVNGNSASSNYNDIF